MRGARCVRRWGRDTFRAVAGVDEPDRLIWVDGEFVPWGQAAVHVLSHSLQRGSLVFDYLSVHETERGPAIFRLPEHLRRFRRSVDLVGLPLELSTDALHRAVVAAVRANPGATAVKISAFLPSIEVDVVPMDPRVSVAIAAYDPVGDVILRHAGRPPERRPVRLWVEKVARNRREDILPPQAKVAANYASPMRAKWEARRRGYDEIVLVDEEGFLAEGPTCNLFLVEADGVLRTPPERRVLHGVTRDSVMALARDEGIPVEEVALAPERLLAAREAFLTGTSAGVWPVESVDGHRLGGPCPGPISKRLADRFELAVAGRDPAFRGWLTFVDETGEG